MFAFHLKKSAGPAGPRLGEITTARGVIETPVFMPVGTYATVKTLTPEDLQEIGAAIILSNTYHLYLRPGVSTIAALGAASASCTGTAPSSPAPAATRSPRLGALIAPPPRQVVTFAVAPGRLQPLPDPGPRGGPPGGVGRRHHDLPGCSVRATRLPAAAVRSRPSDLALGGLHRFMHWDGPILTDSGGYQISAWRPFAPSPTQGVTFRSHLDGSSHFLTPETVVALQEALGVDIMICLDECPGYPAPEAEVVKAADLTLRWAARS